MLPHDNCEVKNSSIKNLYNEIANLELNSTKFIPHDQFYIVKSIFLVKEETLHSLTDILNQCLQLSPKMSACHYSYVEHNGSTQSDIFELSLLFIFSDQENKHQLDGNHHLIISKYVLFISSVFTDIESIQTSIIQFESNMQLFIYLSWFVYNLSRRVLMIKSDGYITNKEINFRTDSELKELLKEKVSIDWDLLPNEEKYGVLKRIKKKSENVVISEQLDVREYKKYINFIFA